MNSLSKQQKELIFDYCFGLTTSEQSAQAQELIFSNSEAGRLHTQLKNSLVPLDSLETESCPDELAEGTVFRLTNFARSSQLHLEQLLHDESAKVVGGAPQTRKNAFGDPGTGRGFWRNAAELAAVAAMILLLAGVSIPTLSSARQRAWQTRCQANLSQIARGINQYALGHEGALPAVSIKKGHPWWKVGSRSKENYSNTRPLWLLVKGGYAEPKHFVCPGRSQGRAIRLSGKHVRELLDFPSRRYVTYSFRLVTNKNMPLDENGQAVLMADLNPVFETIFEIFPKGDCNEFSLKMREELLKMNSRNHNRRGQNVMFGDGRVSFKKRRVIADPISAFEDDIFTVKGKRHYRGCEVPSSDSDTFLAP